MTDLGPDGTVSLPPNTLVLVSCFSVTLLPPVGLYTYRVIPQILGLYCFKVLFFNCIITYTWGSVWSMCPGVHVPMVVRREVGCPRDEATSSCKPPKFPSFHSVYEQSGFPCDPVSQ